MLLEKGGKTLDNKKKPSYSLTNNLRFVLSRLWKRKSMAVLTFLRAPFVVLSVFLGIYLSREVIAAVVTRQAPETILVRIGFISLLLLLSLVIDKYLSARVMAYMMIFDTDLMLGIFDKCLSGDYENIESADGLSRLGKAMDNVGSDQSPSRLVTYTLSSVAVNILGILTYAALLLTLSPWILLVVTVTTLAGFWILKSVATWNYRNKDHWKAYDRKLEYLRTNAGDFTKAKDIRLYGMGDWFRDVFNETLKGRMGWHRKEQLHAFGTDGLRALLSLLRDGVSYGLLAYLLLSRHMAVSDFILYFGIIGQFAASLNGLVEDFNQLTRFSLGFSEIREFLDYPDQANHGPGLPLPEETFAIEFRNVSYRYAGSAEYTIKNLSFTIEKGEKLAIVGPNGAGKTTLVKLLCGLYTPTEGEILINGAPVNAYNREEYYTLFSAVFQDIFVLPQSIACNITASLEAEADRRRVLASAELAGLAQKLGELPDGIDTKLIRSVTDNALDLSGGELQKLALARALYKNGKALILDEPTAALDPIAESHIYMEYNRMTQGHTSVFISHRLASTRFCDRIFFLDQGEVLECGSHDALMAEGGRYCEMFEVQSHYYREEAAENVS
jgi:ABC-type multidrug transport system fused ATPase/permease subunit